MIRYRSFVLVSAIAAITLGLTSGCPTALPNGGGGDDPPPNKCLGVDCDDGDPCTVDSCESATGNCSNTVVDCDDGDDCTDDACIDGDCVFTEVQCDSGETCIDGACLVPSDPCGGVNNGNNVPSREVCGACHDEVDFATGLNHAGGPQANDNTCTACHAASGTGGIAQSFAEAHDWTIDPCGGGTCSNGAICDDGDACTTGDTCGSDGTCAGTAVDCDDGLACTDDSCSDGVCSNTFNCDDGRFCNGTETCGFDGNCRDGTEPCGDEETCDEGADECISMTALGPSIAGYQRGSSDSTPRILDSASPGPERK